MNTGILLGTDSLFNVQPLCIFWKLCEPSSYNFAQRNCAIYIVRSISCSSHIFIFWFLVFWYFGHFSCVIFFPFFFRLAHLALQNVNNNYIIFLYFCNFIGKNDQNPKTKNGMNETFVYLFFVCLQKTWKCRIRFSWK